MGRNCLSDFTRTSLTDSPFSLYLVVSLEYTLPSHKPLLFFLPASLPRIPALLQHQILYFRLQRRLDDVIVVAMRRELHALHCGNHQSQSVQKCAADPCSKNQGMVAIPIRNETWRLYFFVPGTRQNYTM